MMIFRRRSTLRVRFATWIAALLLTTLGVFGLSVYFAMARGLAGSVDDALQFNAAQAIAAIVENGQLSLSDGIPTSPTLSTLQERGFTIRVLTVDGVILRAVGLYRDLLPDSTALRAAQERRPTFQTVIDPVQQEPIRFYTTPILTDNRVIAVVQVAQSLDIMNDTLEQLLTALGVTIPLLVILAAGGGYLLAKRALAPIESIRQTAQDISVHDLKRRLNLRASEDEVGRLAATFDLMLERLDQSFQRERQFTADASHELRTPLTAMQTIIAVTREKRRSPEAYEQVLDDFAEQTSRLRTLVEDLLQLARGDVHSAHRLQRVDLSALLTDVSQAMLPLIEEKHLDFEAQIAAELVVEGDGDDLIRLVMNLLDNAVKYTDRGRVGVQAAAFEGVAQVSIIDTGIGISEGDLPYVFDRFYRQESARTSSGSGLGLSIAQSIVQSHHGSITLSSDVGKGTTVVVTLPRVRSEKITV